MNLKGRKLLIVDDNAENIDILVKMLKDSYELSVSMNGKSALEMAAKVKPDLMLLDVMMPVMDGFQVCETMKKDPALKNIPVIFLTAVHEEEGIVRGFEVGAVDYVKKPFKIAELHARIAAHLELKLAREELLEKNSEYMELLHILCHDLKNPVATINGFCQLAELDEKMTKEALRMSNLCAQQALNIIDLVRNMRVLDEKGIKLEDVNLFKSLSDSIEILKERIKSKNIEIALNVPQKLNVRAEAISIVSSVISNILTNAIKFSPHNSKMEIHSEEKNGNVILHFVDHGIGMPPGIIDKLFDIKGTTSRRGLDGEEGTGFGMLLIAQFMKVYGGKIDVYSIGRETDPEKCGTVVTLTFNKSAT